MAEEAKSNNLPYLPTGVEEVNKMIMDHGDLFSDSECKVCGAILISESQKLSHYQGKKHASKVRRFLSQQNEKERPAKKMKTSDGDNGSSVDERMKACDLCKMNFMSPVMAESHYQGKFHAKRLKMKMVEFHPAGVPETAQQKEKPTSAPAPATATDNSDPDRSCSLCSAFFNNPLMAQQHYLGKKHKKRLNRLKLMETYSSFSEPATTMSGFACRVCNIELNSVEQYQSHISGGKHKHQVKKSTATNKTASQQPTPQPQSTESEQPCTPEKKYTPVKRKYTPADDEYTPGEDDYTTANHNYAPYTAANDDYTPANDKYTPYTSADDKYTPENDSYTSYTPANHNYTTAEDGYEPADEDYAASDSQYGSGEDQYAPGDDHPSAGYQYTPENSEFV